MNADLAALLYLVAAVCFILALRGLSHPTTSRSGNLYGMVGMAIAIFTTLATPGVVSYWLIVVGILIGGTIGTVIALRIQMTALPQLVAAFHSLVGLAAVFVAAAAFFRPEAYGIPATSTWPASSRCRSVLPSAPSPSPARWSLSPNCRVWSAAGRWSSRCSIR